eukprot:TRINITY_DN1442_c0_g1_i1.p1 TRINITY_DN1442_c0_g1~~TRINITY_DN1442_c0_g1_i1.p1  ORF type:complete len:318 (+),score=17.95 TRINITY_DN1442_c0_g1_i1:507-1460(+)
MAMVLKVLSLLAIFELSASGYVAWERAITSFGHHGQNLAKCSKGCAIPTTWTEETPLLIVTTENSQITEEVPVVEYVASTAEEESPSHSCACRPTKPWPYVYKKWGNTNSLFLRFISDHYNKLPLHVVFLHTGKRTWHQSLSVESFLAKYGPRIGDGHTPIMFSPNKVACHNFSSYCDGSSLTAKRFWGAFDNLLPGAVTGLRPHSEYNRCVASSFIGRPCCGEYLVSRSVILRRPHDTYKIIYSRGVEFTTPSNVHDTVSRLSTNLDKRFASHVMDYVWGLIFSEDPSGDIEHGPLQLPSDKTKCSGRVRRYVPRQ